MSKIGKSNVNRAKAHERQVARWLTEWSGVEFRRRRVTGRDYATTTIDGVADVICTRKGFKLVVECKCGKGFSLNHHLASPNRSKFSTWLEQAWTDAKLVNLSPILFFRPAPGQNWIALDETDLYSSPHAWCANHIVIKTELSHVVVCRWEDFAKYANPKDYFAGD